MTGEFEGYKRRASISRNMVSQIISILGVLLGYFKFLKLWIDIVFLIIGSTYRLIINVYCERYFYNQNLLSISVIFCQEANNS